MQQRLLNAALLMSSNSVVVSYHHLTTGAQIRFSDFQRCSFSWRLRPPGGEQKVEGDRRWAGGPSTVFNGTPPVNWGHWLGSMSGETAVEVLHLLILERGV